MPLRVIDNGEVEHHVRVEDQVHNHAAHPQHRCVVVGLKLGPQCNADPHRKVSQERLLISSVLEAKQSVLRVLHFTWRGHYSTASVPPETMPQQILPHECNYNLDLSEK